MRMYFEVMGRLLPQQSEEGSRVIQQQNNMFSRNRANFENNSTR